MWASIIMNDPTHHNWGTWGSRIFIPLSMVLAAVALGAFVVLRRRNTQITNVETRATANAGPIFTALVAVHVGLALLYFGQGHEPKIDRFQSDATNSLLHGASPFGTTQANIFDAFHTPLFYGSGIVVDGRVQVGFKSFGTTASRLVAVSCR
jgi:hypothetical protein